MAFPVSINPSQPANTDAPAGAAAQIRGIKQLIVDLFGLPVDPSLITAAPFTISSGGLVTINISTATVNLEIVHGIISSGSPDIAATVTWNHPGVHFTEDFRNITDTNSLPTSLFDDKRVGDISKYKLRKDGSLQPRVLGNLTGGSTALITAGAAAGVTPTVSISGKDLGGEITVLTGTTATTGILCNVTFSAPLQTAPTVFLLPADQNSANDWSKFYIPAAGDTNAPDTTKFSVHIGTALTDGTTYKFRYFSIENNA
jgi:hypothetical protein